jgi:hypothetical protein
MISDMDGETIYTYEPEDFNGVPNLAEDLREFHAQHAKWLGSERSLEVWVELWLSFESLFFTIKHRALEGRLTQSTAAEMREYAERLVYDYD